MNYNPSPKTELLKRPDRIKAHHVFVEDRVLRDHLDLALQEMQRRASLTDPSNFNSCAASHLRMLGAQEFVDTFLNLAEMPTPASRVDTSNLSSNVPTRKN